MRLQAPSQRSGRDERPQQAAFGIIACLLDERSGSLLPGIAFHMLLDASAFEFALTGTAWIVPSVFLVGGVVILYGAPTATHVARALATSRGRRWPRLPAKSGSAL